MSAAMLTQVVILYFVTVMFGMLFFVANYEGDLAKRIRAVVFWPVTLAVLLVVAVIEGIRDIAEAFDHLFPPKEGG